MSISASDVRKAFQYISRHGISPNRESTKWDIIDPDTGKTWPPKAVLRVAYELARKPQPNAGGGWPTNEPLEALGFEIRLKGDLETSEEAEDLSDIYNQNLEQTQRQRLINARLGQGGYRKALEDIWDKKCALTGCEVGCALRASHIRPWRDSSNVQRLDPRNGFLLIANADAIFDKGLISFSDDGVMLVSERISNESLLEIGISSRMKINVHRATVKYLQYHRKNCFN